MIGMSLLHVYEKFKSKLTVCMMFLFGSIDVYINIVCSFTTTAQT